MIASNEKLLLNLIKMALGKSAECALPDALEWSTLFGLSVKQCVPSVVLDGLNKSLVSAALPGKGVGKTDKLKWLGMLLNMERQYAIHESVVAALAAVYQSAGYRMMLLKGYGLSKYWPIPNHRPTGDIDIYLMYMDSDGKDKYQPAAWKRADLMMKEKFGVEIDNSHHHHSVFTYKGIMVENHYDFINVHSHRSNQWIENEFKTLALTGSEEYTFDNGAKLLFPSPLLNCIFVARHNACHFAAEHLNLRQLLDWALFVEKRNEDMDWDYFWSTAKKMGMEKFVLCMAFIAIEQLSFEKSIFHIPDEYMDFQKCEHDLIDKVFDDILHPTDEGNDGKGLVYVVRRFKLWKRNLWKHRIVYSDSVVSTFYAQIKSHLMKPTTIFGI